MLVHAASWAAETGPRAGFIHVPWAAGQAPGNEPELPPEDIARAIEIAVRTTLDTPQAIAAVDEPLRASAPPARLDPP